LLTNATDGLQDHVEELYLATVLATNITEQLQQAAHEASWRSNLNPLDWLHEITFRAACVLIACIVLRFQGDSTMVGIIGEISGSELSES
jgi:hypothetical protein